MTIKKRKESECEIENGEKELKSRETYTFFEILNVLRGKSDSDLVDLLLTLLQTGFRWLHCSVRHCVRMIPSAHRMNNAK